MKLIPKTIFSFFVMAISINGFAQDGTNLSEAEVRTLLCKKWKAVSMEANGKKAVVTQASIISFATDGTFSDSTQGFKKSIGTWVYHQLSKSLEMNEQGGKSNVQLLELNSNNLIMEFQYPNFKSRVIYSIVK